LVTDTFRVYEGGYSPASYHWGPDLGPGQSTWVLQWTKQHWDWTLVVLLHCQYHSTVAPYSPVYHLEDGQRAFCRPVSHRRSLIPL